MAPKQCEGAIFSALGDEGKLRRFARLWRIATFRQAVGLRPVPFPWRSLPRGLSICDTSRHKAAFALWRRENNWSAQEMPPQFSMADDQDLGHVQLRHPELQRSRNP